MVFHLLFGGTGTDTVLSPCSAATIQRARAAETERTAKIGVRTCVVTSSGVHSPAKRRHSVRSRVLMKSPFAIMRSSGDLTSVISESFLARSSRAQVPATSKPKTSIETRRHRRSSTSTPEMHCSLAICKTEASPGSRIAANIGSSGGAGRISKLLKTFSISADSPASLARSSAATAVVVSTFGNNLAKRCPKPALHSEITGLVLQTTARWKNSEMGEL